MVEASPELAILAPADKPRADETEANRYRVARAFGNSTTRVRARELLDLHRKKKTRPVHAPTNAIEILACDAKLPRRLLTGHAGLI